MQSCRTQAHAINVLDRVARPGACRADRLTGTASRWASRLPCVRVACQAFSLVRGSCQAPALVCFRQQLAVQLCVSQYASMGLPSGNTKPRNGGWVGRCLSMQRAATVPRLVLLTLWPGTGFPARWSGRTICLPAACFAPWAHTLPLPFQPLMYMFWGRAYRGCKCQDVCRVAAHCIVPSQGGWERGRKV